MGLEEVVSEIMADAERSARRAISEAENEARQAVEAARSSAERMEREAVESARQKAEALRRAELGTQRIENRKRMLAAQKQAIERAYEIAKERAAALPEGDKKRIYSSCLAAARKRIGVKAVYCTPRDEAIVRQIAEEAEVRPTLDGLGGIIVEGESGEAIENYTFEAAFERVRESTLGEVHAIIVGGEQWQA